MRIAKYSFVIVILFLLGLPLHQAQAGSRDNPPPLPGWTHPVRFPDDTPEQHGVVLPGSAVVRGSPVIGEIDGNYGDHKEVAVGGSDGMVYVYRSDGRLLWAKDVMPRCQEPGGEIHSAPAVGQLFGDGVPYLIVSYGIFGQEAHDGCHGGVVALRGSDGDERWRYNLGAISPPGVESMHGVISSPAIADTDHDGRMEVAFGGFDRNVHLLNADGSIRWIYHAADTVWSSAAFTNVDGDSALELIIGTDIYGNPQMIPPTRDGGYVYAFDTQQRHPERIGFNTGYIWQTYFDQAIYSSPAVGDVLPWSPGPEIVVGASCYHPESTSDKNGKWLKILRPRDGAVLQTLNASACVQSSPALGDIDDDGALEIVATVNGAQNIGGDGFSRITAWNPTDPNPMWSMVPHDANSGNNDPYGGDLQSPVIADLDGNGSLEVAAANHWSVHVLDGRTGRPLTCQKEADCGSQTSFYGWFTVKSTPAIGDINEDGKLDMVIGGGQIYSEISGAKKGMLYAWTNIAGHISSSRGNHPAYSAPWPMFRGDPQHTGVFRIYEPSPREFGLLLKPVGTTTARIVFRTSDGTPFRWQVSEGETLSLVSQSALTGVDAVPVRVSLSPTSGGESDPLTITVRAPDTKGLYQGTLRVNVGTQTITIPIRVSVGNVRRVFVPMVKH